MFTKTYKELADSEERFRILNRELEARVRRLMLELEAVNRELESFSYSVSHDLQAPLRAIGGFSRILQEDFSRNLDPAVKGYLDMIEKNAMQMSVLIESLLRFSRLSCHPLDRQGVDAGQIVDQCLEAARQPGPTACAEVHIGNLPSCSGDPNLIKQVFGNLISNAFKFSRKQAHPRIEIGSIAAPGETIYFVKDNGAGFDMKYKEKLFGVFQRLHSWDEFEGSGIGLALVERIVRRHGGKVWAEAEIDQGATFYFSLPTAESIK